MSKLLPAVSSGARARRFVLALFVAMLSTGSVGAASSLASEAGGADTPRAATFGDCPHENNGVHNGYDCVIEELPG